MNKPGRRGKVQLVCKKCLLQCHPKDGDWFLNRDSSEQFFLCKVCEVKEKDKPKRAALTV